MNDEKIEVSDEVPEIVHVHDGLSLTRKHTETNLEVLSELRKELTNAGENVIVKGLTRSSLEMGVMDVDTVLDTDTVQKIAQKKHWLRTLTSPKTICKGCLILVAVLAVVVGVNLIPKAFWIALFSWIESLGYWAPVVFFVFEVVTCVLSIPPTFTLMFAGFLMGFLKGIIAGHIAHIIGSSISFMLCKYILRRKMRSKFGDNKFYRALEIAVENNSLKIAIMLRACPILPIIAVTYMLSLSGVKYWHFLLATSIILIPEESFYVYLGSTASSLTKLVSGDVTGGSWVQTAIMVIGVILSVVMAIGASLMVKFQIDKVLKAEKRRKKAEAEAAKLEEEAEGASSGGDSGSDGESGESIAGAATETKVDPDAPQTDSTVPYPTMALPSSPQLGAEDLYGVDIAADELQIAPPGEKFGLSDIECDKEYEIV